MTSEVGFAALSKLDRVVFLVMLLGNITVLVEAFFDLSRAYDFPRPSCPHACRDHTCIHPDHANADTNNSTPLSAKLLYLKQKRRYDSIRQSKLGILYHIEPTYFNI